MLNAGRILSRLTAALLCVAVLLSVTPLAVADGGPITPLPGDTIDIGDTSARSGDGWEFDGVDTYTITGDVNVVGDNYDGGALVFDISDNHTVTWKACYLGSSTDATDVLVDVKGSGIFQMDAGGYITLWGPGVAVRSAIEVAVVVSGGSEVTADGDDLSCIAIRAYGSVSVTDDCWIWAESDSSCTAIYADGDVMVDSSLVVADSPYGVAIRSDYAIQIEVTGSGKVWGGGGAVLAKQAAVTISGDSLVNVTGILAFVNGELLGNAIVAKDVAVRDYARVKALNGAAIFFSGDLDISGGLVLAYGDGIGGAQFKIDSEEELEISHVLNVIFKTRSLDIEAGIKYLDSSNPAAGINGDGIALAWDFIAWFYADEPYGYYRDDTTDLFVCPGEGADFGWEGRRLNFWFSHGDNSGSFWFDTMFPTKPLKPNPKPDPDTDPGKTIPGGTPSTSNPSGSFSGGSAYTKGAGSGVVYTVQKDFSLFSGVKVDGGTLAKDQDYRAANGSTKITLLSVYLDKLSAGTHTLTVTFTDNTSATASFTIAAGPGLPFTDVAASAWYFNAVAYVYGSGLMVGTSETKFSPDTDLSRAMIVTILYRNAGEPSVSGLTNPFSDVPGNTWYTNAVKWAASKSIVLGYNNGKFGPDDPVTKEQLAALIYRTQQYSGKKPPNTGAGKTFSDAGKVSDWAKTAVNTLNNQGVFNDIPGNAFNPQTPASRSEIASMLYRWLTSTI